MKLPKTVQVGPIRYAIVADEVEINKERVEAEDGRWGSIDTKGQRIVLDPTMGPDFTGEVLLHELTHAFLYHSGAEENLSKLQLEQVCNAVSHMVLATLRSNPTLVNFLLEA